MEKLISIVVPVYNMGDTIEECISSICRQDYKNIEVIVVDDGSTDDSFKRCIKVAKKDKRIKVFHTKNQGSGPARNFGIAHAKGDYICFPDADDTLSTNAITLLANATADGKHDLVIAGYALLDSTEKTIKKQVYPNIVVAGDSIRSNYSAYSGSKSRLPINGAPWIKLFSLSIIKKYRIEYPSLRRHQDTAFVFRYINYTESVHYIADILYYHHINDISKVWEKYPRDYLEICVELNRIMKETVLSWNPSDTDTKELIAQNYLTKVVKAIELTYSRKFNLSFSEKVEWLKKKDEQYCLSQEKIPNILNRYHKIVLYQLFQRNYFLVVLLCGIKVSVEKRGKLSLVKYFLGR